MAAQSGDTVKVCSGTYDEQVSISTSNIAISGMGSSTVIDPSSTPKTVVEDSDTDMPLVPIVDVTPGITGVRISDLVVDGEGLGPIVGGCSEQFAGILYQASSGEIESTTVENVIVANKFVGCGDGNAILVEGAPTGTPNRTTGSSKVMIVANSVTNYDKNAITCNDNGTSCLITNNRTTGLGPTTLIAQNGVQLGFGATGSVMDNHVADNDFTGTPNPTEPQADYAAGVILYGANSSTGVQANVLTNDQIGVEVVHSSAAVNQNSFTETSPGLDNSIGIFAVPCDYYCSSFGLSGGSQTLVARDNNIAFPGSPTTGTIGIWVGDEAASATGSVTVAAVDNQINGAESNVVLGPTASGTVTTS
jgi:hypothetical protein